MLLGSHRSRFRVLDADGLHFLTTKSDSFSLAMPFLGLASRRHSLSSHQHADRLERCIRKALLDMLATMALTKVT